MSDETTTAPTTDLERALLEMTGLKEGLQAAISAVCEKQAQALGHPVHPDVLCGLILGEVGTVTLKWGLALQRRPEEIENYFEGLLRRARRGFRAQLVQVFDSQKKVITS